MPYPRISSDTLEFLQNFEVTGKNQASLDTYCYDFTSLTFEEILGFVKDSSSHYSSPHSWMSFEEAISGAVTNLYSRMLPELDEKEDRADDFPGWYKEFAGFVVVAGYYDRLFNRYGSGSLVSTLCEGRISHFLKTVVKEDSCVTCHLAWEILGRSGLRNVFDTPMLEQILKRITDSVSRKRPSDEEAHDYARVVLAAENAGIKIKYPNDNPFSIPALALELDKPYCTSLTALYRDEELLFLVSSSPDSFFNWYCAYPNNMGEWCSEIRSMLKDESDMGSSTDAIEFISKTTELFRKIEKRDPNSFAFPTLRKEKQQWGAFLQEVKALTPIRGLSGLMAKKFEAALRL